MDPMSLALIGGGSALSGLAGIGGSFLQSGSARDAARQQEIGLNRASGALRGSADRSMAAYQPYQDLNYQQANAFSQALGMGPVVGQDVLSGNPFDQYGTYVDENQDLGNAFSSMSEKDRNHLVKEGHDLDGDGNINKSEYGQYHYSRYGERENRQLPTYQEPQTAGGTAAASEPVDPLAGFNESAFAEIANIGASRDVDRIDSALGAQGALFSSSRQAHADDAYADNMGNAFSQYMNSLMGAPNMQGVNAVQGIDQNYAANQANIFGQMGQANAQGTINQGNAWASGLQTAGNSALTGLGLYGAYGRN